MAFWQVPKAIHLDGELPEDMIVPRIRNEPAPSTGPLRDMPLSSFAKIAMVVNYYHCVDAMDKAANI